MASADDARAYFERQRWPDGPSCPHCAAVKQAVNIAARPGAFHCKACRKQFTVLVGTIFEGSHLPLEKWLQAVHLLCSVQSGVTVERLAQAIGVTYKTAWSMNRRIRKAASEQPLRSRLTRLHPKRPLALTPLSPEEAIAGLLQAQPKKREVDQEKVAHLVERLNARQP